ncbi:small cardioactive peptides-like isoform X3 [Haliotis cracherodii]|uniref:small cardioactive peptides-like isoform X3 n=1 Tax=Haliotis rufescens TaxID=6454 RepID=UPI001EB0319F|nr:small cardioactive peptides-like isoform X3 [Haliotis rufescens]
MEASAIRLSIGLVVILVVGSEAMNYLAFPRMGRSGYLAFPRMGRAGQQTAGSDECCTMGLKNEWVVGDDGKAEVRNICQAGKVCCSGLKETVDRKFDDGVFYSMCLPECYKPQTVNKSVLGKLKRLLQQ